MHSQHTVHLKTQSRRPLEKYSVEARPRFQYERRCATEKAQASPMIETRISIYKWLCLKQGVHRIEKKAEKIRSNLYKLHEKGWIIIGRDIHIDNPSRSDLTRVADQRFTQAHPTEKRKRKMVDQWYWIYGCGISAGRAEAQPRESIVM